MHSKNDDKLVSENKEQAEKILKDIENERFQVIEVKKGTRKRSPSPTFTTSSMQQEASRKLGFTAKKTMMVAQQLYEGLDVKGEGTVGLITYMRTDSTRVSDQAKREAAAYIESNFGKDYLGHGDASRKSTKNVQDAHEGIRPTSVFRSPDKVKDSLTKEQFLLYKLIWERFTSSQMAPAIYDTISIRIKAGEYIFVVSGSTLKFPGFMLLYTEGSDEESEREENHIPDLEKDRP